MLVPRDSRVKNAEIGVKSLTLRENPRLLSHQQENTKWLFSRYLAPVNHRCKSWSGAGGAKAHGMSRESPAEERYLVYLARAEEARQIALTIHDTQARLSWERLADSWQQLAEQIARMRGIRSPFD